MRLSLIELYAITAETVERAARFYGAVLDAEPVREQHGGGPEHYSITCTETGLVVEVYPPEQRPHTATRLEFIGDAEPAVERLIERSYSLPERTPDGDGWWCSDPIGNTVVLIRDPDATSR